MEVIYTVMDFLKFNIDWNILVSKQLYFSLINFLKNSLTFHLTNIPISCKI